MSKKRTTIPLDCHTTLAMTTAALDGQKPSAHYVHQNSPPANFCHTLNNSWISAFAGMTTPFNDNVGTNLREDKTGSTLYYNLKDARHHARLLERQQEETGITANTDTWESILNSALDILTNHSKDFEVMSWLVEALLRKHQFRGLAKGFALATDLARNYWDTGFPQSDNDSFIKLAGFTALNGLEKPGTLIAPILNCPITEKIIFKSWHYKSATKSTELLKEIQQAAANSSPEFVTQLKKDITDCEENFETFTAYFHNIFGPDALPSSQIKEALETVSQTVAFLYPDQITTPSEEIIEPSIKENNKIPSREQAFEQLKLAAIYFKKYEPHSPLPYLINRALHWGQLSFPELIKELIHDSGARTGVYELIGVEEQV